MPLRVRDAAYVLFSPRSVFRRMDDTPAYGWTFALIIALTVLAGMVTIQGGLIDQDIGRMTEERLARLELDQFDLISRSELSQRMQDVREEGEFWLVMAHGQAMLLAPIQLVVSVLLIASVLYASVALSGRKPEYHTLVSICVYASVVEVLALVFRVVLMLFWRTSDVDTSLALLVRGLESPGAAQVVLGGIDPFIVWFWCLVRTGLVSTWQLGRASSAVVCALMLLLSCGLRVLAAASAQGGLQGAGG